MYLINKNFYMKIHSKNIETPKNSQNAGGGVIFS